MIYLFFKILPKNLISSLVGILSQVKKPIFFKNWVLKAFASFFKIDLSECGRDLYDYKNLDLFFTRTLKEGARPIAKNGHISPCDGTLVLSQKISQDTLLQAKDLHFSANALIGEHNKNELNWSYTIYLAPYNYHRVHVPSSAFLTEITHIPGTLWPVNNLCVPRVSKLFIENERVVFKFFDETHNAYYWLVMVGALNVGKIKTPYSPSLGQNFKERQSFERQKFSNLFLEKGSDLGVFHFGSTVVSIFDDKFNNFFSFKEIASPRPVKMGELLFEEKK